jgi:hypothetical protein
LGVFGVRWQMWGGGGKGIYKNGVLLYYLKIS